MKTHRSGVRTTVLILFISSLALANHPPSTTAKPTWLVEDAYVTYEQVFSWSGHTEMENMTWQIISIEGDHVNISVTSYTIDESLDVVPTFSNHTVNSSTREIVSSTEPLVVGSKWFFWMETNVSVGTMVDTGFGSASISRSEKIAVLGQERDTWFVEHYWAATTYMKRWYDQATGIVLRIQVWLVKSGTQIRVTETAESTNIDFPSLQPNDSGLTVPLSVWLVAIFSAIAVASFGVAAVLKWKARQVKQKGKLEKAMLGVQLEDTGGF